MKSLHALVLADLISNYDGYSKLYNRYVYTKPSSYCNLPSCGKLTSHNGGYCCAEHCRLHKQQLKQNK